MSKQMTLGTGFEKYSKTTRREKFLTEMDRIVPWGDGRPPKELEIMLRIYFVQQWFNLSDPGVEEALYDSLSMRRFAGIDLGEMPVPDESTVCRFRHLLEAHALGKKLFEQVHAYLECRGIKIGTGTIVDATIISAPPSTKNKDKRRDPDMHQTKKGNHGMRARAREWPCLARRGRRAHIGVDSQTKVIHAVAATPANVHDSVCLSNLSFFAHAR